MEPRKIQRVGKSTLTVSLPSDWAKQYGIEKGDHVYLSEMGNGAVTVYPDVSGAVPTQTVTVDASSLSPVTLERAVVGGYVLGRDKITVEDTDGLGDDDIGALYDAESQLIGAGIVEEGPEKVVIRCSLSADSFSVGELLTRLNSTAETMRHEAVNSLLEDDASLAERAAKREKQANKVFVLLLRLILTAQQNPMLVERIGLDSSLHLIGTRASAKSLERLADYAHDMSDCSTELLEAGWYPDEELDREISELVETTDEVCGKALESLKQGDMSAAEDARYAFTESKETQERIMTRLFEKETDPKSLTTVNRMLSALVESSKEAIEIAEVGSNRALETAGENVEL